MLEQALNEIISGVPPNPNTYKGADGRLYCNKHHKPVQHRINDIFKGGQRLINCMCSDCRAELDKQEAEQLHKGRTEARRRAAFPQQNMTEWTFENDDKQRRNISEALERYANNFEKYKKDGKGIVLFGTVGTGKSYYAACIVNKLIDLGYKAKFTNIEEVINRLQENFEDRQAVFDQLNKYDLLVIDDLAAEAGTEYRQKVVYDVVNNRVQARLPIVVTTNLTTDEFQKPKDRDFERISDKLLGACVFIEMTGESRRRQKFRQEQINNKKALGL